MDDTTPVTTWDVLRDFGFVPDLAVISEEMPGLSIDFGNFKLSAGAVTNRWFRPVILFSGVLATSRTISEVSYELPIVVRSRNQLAAFLVHYLDNAASDGDFRPERDVWWIAEGRMHEDLLPWNAQIAAYEASPRCSVKRAWLRLALNNLTELLGDANDSDEVEFGFDGSILWIKCSGQTIAMSAEGTAWPAKFAIPARKMRHLPKRLAHDMTDVSVNNGRLRIGARCFEGAMERLPH